MSRKKSAIEKEFENRFIKPRKKKATKRKIADAINKVFFKRKKKVKRKAIKGKDTKTGKKVKLNF
jgi:hypothetical protein